MPIGEGEKGGSQKEQYAFLEDSVDDTGVESSSGLSSRQWNGTRTPPNTQVSVHRVRGNRRSQLRHKDDDKGQRAESEWMLCGDPESDGNRRGLGYKNFQRTALL